MLRLFALAALVLVAQAGPMREESSMEYSEEYSYETYEEDRDESSMEYSEEYSYETYEEDRSDSYEYSESESESESEDRDNYYDYYNYGYYGPAANIYDATYGGAYYGGYYGDDADCYGDAYYDYYGNAGDIYDHYYDHYDNDVHSDYYEHYEHYNNYDNYDHYDHYDHYDYVAPCYDEPPPAPDCYDAAYDWYPEPACYDDAPPPPPCAEEWYPEPEYTCDEYAPEYYPSYYDPANYGYYDPANYYYDPAFYGYDDADCDDTYPYDYARDDESYEDEEEDCPCMEMAEEMFEDFDLEDFYDMMDELAALDVDGDGTITIDEFQPLEDEFGCDAEFIADMLDFDEDGDVDMYDGAIALEFATMDSEEWDEFLEAYGDEFDEYCDGSFEYGSGSY